MKSVHLFSDSSVLFRVSLQLLFLAIYVLRHAHLFLLVVSYPVHGVRDSAYDWLGIISDCCLTEVTAWMDVALKDPLMYSINRRL